MSSTDLIHATQVRKTRCSNLTPIGSFAAIADDEYTHFSLGSFDDAVGFARWDGVTLGEEEEVVDQGFHVFFHCGTWWRVDLVVLDADGTRSDFIETLVDDAKGLAELFHADEVAVVAVTIDADGDVEFDLIIGIVRLGFTNVPRNTRTTEHDTGERIVEGISCTHYTNTFGAANPDTVIGQEFLGFVDSVTELGGPLVDIVEKTERNILVDTTGTNISGMKAST